MLMDILRMLLKTKRIRVSEKDIDQRVAKNAMVQNPIKYFVEECIISVPFGTISLGVVLPDMVDKMMYQHA